MEYMDIAIASRRYKAKRERDLALFSVNRVSNLSGVVYSFVRVCMADGYSAILPEQFSAMGQDARQIKYPTESRPRNIFTNQDGTINIIFSLLEQPFESSQLDAALEEYSLAIKRICPANVFLTNKVLVQNQKKGGYFDYKGYALDSDLGGVRKMLS